MPRLQRPEAAPAEASQSGGSHRPAGQKPARKVSLKGNARADGGTCYTPLEEARDRLPGAAARHRSHSILIGPPLLVGPHHALTLPVVRQEVCEALPGAVLLPPCARCKYHI